MTEWINSKICELFCSPSRTKSSLILFIKYRVCSWVCGNGRSSIANDIESARDEAMRRAGYRCQITGGKDNLHGHHLFDVSTFPYFAASPWNFFILIERLHTKYHSWNGGTQKPCTIFGFWFWRYFVLQWWKGYSLASAVMACVFYFLSQTPNL